MSDIYVDDLGKGFPFVFVHGYLGSSEMWCFQKNYFSKYYRVIAPALPGFGESYNAKSLNSINDMANKIIEILNQKKIDKFNLIGHSMGGMVVQCRRCGARSLWQQTPDCTPALLKDTKRRQTMR